ncbi:hypothetical protein ACOYW6_13005 [Parablastomonas sp. CN1-191]|uniref:hypothetical protein n=1 Tax=Parablastomonas sp. CN1-191 TaxID=3400908 RepID=UPI003BF8AC98
MKSAFCFAAAVALAFPAHAQAHQAVVQSVTVSGIVLSACRAGQSQVLFQEGRTIRLETGGICRNQLGYEVSLSRSAALAGATIYLDGRLVAGSQEAHGAAAGAAVGTLGLKISPRL